MSVGLQQQSKKIASHARLSISIHENSCHFKFYIHLNNNRVRTRRNSIQEFFESQIGDHFSRVIGDQSINTLRG